MFVDRIVKGDTLNFTVSVPEYPPADGWQLKYRLVQRDGAGDYSFTAVVASDGVSYEVQVPPSTTAGYEPGKYSWSRWVEKAGARQTLDWGDDLEILEDPASVTAGTDTRSHNRKVLDQLEALLDGRSILDQDSYTIKDRQLNRMPIEELREWANEYRRRCADEDQVKKGKKSGPMGRIKYGVPS